MIFPFSLLFTYVIHLLSSSLFILPKAKDAFDDQMDGLKDSPFIFTFYASSDKLYISKCKRKQVYANTCFLPSIFPVLQDKNWKSDTKTHT